MVQHIRIKMINKEENLALSGTVVTVSSIRNAFLLPANAIVGLSFESNGMQIHCATNENGTAYLLPDGWSNMQFLAKSNIVPPRPMTLMDIRERPLSPSKVEKSNWLTSIKNAWENRVFRIDGNKLTGTCVLIDKRHVLTAAHLSFTLNQLYKIKGNRNQEFSVTCVFICKFLDFAILESDDIPLLELPIGSLDKGDKYFMMGYPIGEYSSNPTITQGIIEGRTEDCMQLVGTPGSKRGGYSGAPVINVSGRLAGLLLGSTHELNVNTTLQKCLDSSAEQKYARIMGVAFIVKYTANVVQTQSKWSNLSKAPETVSQGTFNCLLKNASLRSDVLFMEKLGRITPWLLEGLMTFSIRSVQLHNSYLEIEDLATIIQNWLQTERGAGWILKVDNGCRGGFVWWGIKERFNFVEVQLSRTNPGPIRQCLARPINSTSKPYLLGQPNFEFESVSQIVLKVLTSRPAVPADAKESTSHIFEICIQAFILLSLF